MQFRLAAAAAASLILAVCATSVTASTVQFHYQDSHSPFGSPNHSETVRVTSPDFSGTVYAGPFRMTGGGLGDFVAFCIDLAQRLKNGADYVEAPSLIGGSRLDLLDRLFTGSYAGIDSAEKGAGFQLAIWEIISEDIGSNPLDLGAGAFSASRNVGAIAAGQAYLDGLAQSGTGGYKLRFFASGTSQDLVTAAPVPLPAGILLLGTALGGLGLMRRRRRTA